MQKSAATATTTYSSSSSRNSKAHFALAMGVGKWKGLGGGGSCLSLRQHWINKLEAVKALSTAQVEGIEWFEHRIVQKAFVCDARPKCTITECWTKQNWFTPWLCVAHNSCSLRGSPALCKLAFRPKMASVLAEAAGKGRTITQYAKRMNVLNGWMLLNA